MSEQQEAHPTARKRVQKFGFMLCMLLVVVGILFNITVLFNPTSYVNNPPLYISTLVLCLAVIIGLLALMAEE